ncbi:hypothetical protein JCM9279_003225 [Rhodotorula babjevae]
MPAPSQQAARSADTGTSVRARSRHDPQDAQRKTVYKPVLANPLTIDWPPLPASVRRAILDHLLAVLATSTTVSGKSIQDWRLDEHARRRGNSRRTLPGPDTKSEGKGKSKGSSTKSGADDQPTPSDDATHTVTTRSSSTYSIPSSQPHPPPPSAVCAESAPPVLSHLVLGINEVTRALETRIRWGRWELGDRTAAPSSSLSLPPPPEPRTGRHRRRKSAKGKEPGAPPAVLPHPPARSAPQPLPLADHPSYAFLRQRRMPKPALDHRPPYVIVVKGPSSGRNVQRERSVRLLVNSDARRVTGGARAGPAAAAEGTLVPTQPTAADVDDDDAMDTDVEPELKASAPAPVPAPTPSPPPTVPLIDLVLVCRPDINPPSLVAHLPSMVAAANGVQSALDGVLGASQPGSGEEDKGEGDAARRDGRAGKKSARPEMRCVRLVQLDAGAERKLADALGLRRVAAIGLSSLAPGTAPLLDLIDSHLPTPLSAPWLVPHLLHPPSSSSNTATSTTPAAASPSRFAPTAIKHLKTSAPLNPRAAVVDKKVKRRRAREDKAERLGKRRRGEAGGSGSGSREESVYMAED